MNKIALFVLVFLCGVVCGVRLRRNITISKCCKTTEYLNNQQQCQASSNSHNLHWKLRVYRLAKKDFINDQILEHWTLVEDRKPSACSNLVLNTNEKNFMPFSNGSAFVLEYNRVIDSDKYCIDYNGLALLCMDQQDHGRPEKISKATVRKCCFDNGIFSETNSSCIHMKVDEYKINLGPEVQLGGGFPDCVHQDLVQTGRLELGLQQNGSLWLEKLKVLIPAGKFCLEHVLEQAGRLPSIFTCQNYLPSPVTVKPAQNGDDDVRFIIYPIGLALSAIFLAATLVAGSLLPSSHHVLHWRCQTNHVACLLLGDILLCITHLSGEMPRTWCVFIAVLMHFLFLAAFFWLNTMCFNIWWTFRDLRPQSTEKRQERLRLTLYHIYAWGLPIMIASLALILDLVPTDSAILRPRFGDNQCWFAGDVEIFTFFFGPVGTLLVINLSLFGLTARELTCGLWKRELVKSTTERAALGRVCLKLVIVMGVTWIADVISWAVGGPQEFWYVTDVINSLHGVFIFIVVGCQPQVLSAVKRLWCLRNHIQNGTAGTTNHHSSSSQGPPSMGDTLTNTNSITNNTTKCVPLETSC